MERGEREVHAIDRHAAGVVDDRERVGRAAELVGGGAMRRTFLGAYVEVLDAQRVADVERARRVGRSIELTDEIDVVIEPPWVGLEQAEADGETASGERRDERPRGASTSAGVRLYDGPLADVLGDPGG